jgi:hypothetical protein
MGEGIVSTKEDLQRILDLVTKSSKIPEKEVIEIKKRIQMALNILIQNERKIWLRTREGKEMLMEFGAAAAKLVDAAERMRRSEAQDPKALSNFGSALGEVERCAKSLEEESRKRGMVVT